MRQATVREQAGCATMHRRVAGVHQQEGAGAVGALGVAGREAAPGRTAPPAGRPRCRAIGMPSGRPGTPRVSPRPPAEARTSGSTPRGTPKSSHSSSVQAQRAQVEEQRARGVGDVGDVGRAAGEAPDAGSCRRCRSASSPRSARARRPGTWSEQPGDLGAGEVGIEHQAGALRGRAARARRRSQRARRRRRCGGPARRWRGASGVPVARSQRTRGLALVGDADGGDVARSIAACARAPRRARRAPTRQIASGSCSTQPGLRDRSGGTRGSRGRARRALVEHAARWCRWFPDRCWPTSFMVGSRKVALRAGAPAADQCASKKRAMASTNVARSTSMASRCPDRGSTAAPPPPTPACRRPRVYPPAARCDPALRGRPGWGS